MYNMNEWGLKYIVQHVRDGEVVEEVIARNLIPQSGVDHLAGLIRGLATPISDWYVGLFAGNYVPTKATTAADLPTTAGESVAYDETTRPAWVHQYDGVSDISNELNRAEFTFNTDQRIYGGFIVSSNGKGNGAGVLFSIVRFPSPIDVAAGSTLRVLAGTLIVTTE